MVYYPEYNVFARKGAPFVPLEQIKEVIDNIGDEHRTFSICGGEPTIDPNFFEVLEYARNKHSNMLLHVVSNGRMFYYKDFTRKLASLNLNPLRLDITLYSHRPEIHDKITQVKGSFNQTLKGIQNLLSAGIEVELRIIIQKSNFRELPDFAEFVVRRVPHIFRLDLVNMKYTGNALENFKEVAVSVKEVVPYAERAADIASPHIKFRLFHFPLCILRERYWKYAEGVTKNEELIFIDTCKKCRVRNRCCRLWASYVGMFGGEEFHAVENPGKNFKPTIAQKKHLGR